MKIRSCAVLVTVALCTSLLTRLDAQTSQEGLTVAVNGRTFSAGRTMVVTGKLTPLAIPQAVDAYVVVQLPTGQYLSLQLSGFLVPGIVPIARGFVPFSYEAPLVQYTFSGGEPAGAYTWYVGLARPGTLDLIAPVQQVEFTFSISTPETSAHSAIGLTTPSPSSVPVGSLTVVTVTSQLKDPQVVPSSVTLERLDPTGAVTVIGTLRDDGSAGDVTAGDRIFSIRLSLTPPFPELLEYRVSAALSGVLARVTSDAFSIHAFAPKTAEQTLSLLSNELEKGALENVTRYFGPSAANKMIFGKLPEPVRLAMAAALRGATLTRDTGNVRYYSISWVHDGKPLQFEIALKQSSLGEWFVVNW